jgi:hypothetical protein
MESMWNANIPWNVHGIHMDSMWNMWVPSGICPWNPCGMDIFHGFHMEWGIIFHVDSTDIPWNDSTWIPCGMGDLVEF